MSCRKQASKQASKGLERVLTVQNHVLNSVNHSDVASLVDGGQVAGAEPAIREGLQACLGQLPVAAEQSGPSALDLTHLSGARLQGIALWAHQAHIQEAEGAPRCAHKVQLLLCTASAHTYIMMHAPSAMCRHQSDCTMHSHAACQVNTQRRMQVCAVTCTMSCSTRSANTQQHTLTVSIAETSVQPVKGDTVLSLRHELTGSQHPHCIHANIA